MMAGIDRNMLLALVQIEAVRWFAAIDRLEPLYRLMTLQKADQDGATTSLRKRRAVQQFDRIGAECLEDACKELDIDRHLPIALDEFVA